MDRVLEILWLMRKFDKILLADRNFNYNSSSFSRLFSFYFVPGVKFIFYPLRPFHIPSSGKLKLVDFRTVSVTESNLRTKLCQHPPILLASVNSVILVMSGLKSSSINSKQRE